MCKLFEKDSLYFEPKINPVRRARKLEHENIMENSGFTPEVIWNKVRDKMTSEYAEEDKHDTKWGEVPVIVAVKFAVDSSPESATTFTW